jgi:UDP-N-acetylmuramoyl-tripeptide--D-alanyl-D-alanine ligase
VKPQPNGSITIDDAFNSNPAGFKGALELMTMLAGGKPRRRVLVTPGLVELGARHDAIHRDLGIAAARHADVALAVRPERIEAFIDGFRSAKTTGVLTPVADLAEAQKWLVANAKPDDILLIENDLPDVFERNLKI